jgi:peroxiredoxin
LLLACARQTSTPESLDQAPGFELVATDGRTVALADYTGQQPVLLFFHMAVG